MEGNVAEKYSSLRYGGQGRVVEKHSSLRYGGQGRVVEKYFSLRYGGQGRVVEKYSSLRYGGLAYQPLVRAVLLMSSHSCSVLSQGWSTLSLFRACLLYLF